MRRIGLLAVMAGVLLLAACSDEDTAGPVTSCPTTLVAQANWFETDADFGGVSTVTFDLTFELATGAAADFAAASADTYQLWTTPGVEDPPVTVVTSPAGLTVGDGGQFDYDFSVDVSGLPASETGIAFRVVSITNGTMPPSSAPLVSAAITCS